MASGSPLQEFHGAGPAAAGVPVGGLPGLPSLSGPPHENSQTRAGGLLVLSRDEALVRTLKTLGSEHDVFSVGAESDFAAHLLGQSTGVAILDASAVASPIERLAERLRAQFPELVLIVAGSVEDQSALATQITNGTVYRFLHKPVSEQRVRLFVEAAWRRHTEEHASADGAASAAQPARERPGSTANMLVLSGAAVAAVALLGGWLLLHRSDSHPPQVSASNVADTAPVVEPRDAVLEDQLMRAEKALASGALVSPPGANAADLYAQALRRNPQDSRAANGVEKVIDRLLSAAEAQLLAQHIDEAQKLTDQARAIKPDHVRVAFLLAQIGKERERATLAQARQAASSGNIEQAISVLDGASRDGQRSTLVTEARQELEHKKLDERIHDYVSRANDRIRDGDLVEPAQDNAQFYIESARALAPNDAEVKQTQRQFFDRLVSEARKALLAGNAEQGEHWIQVASDAGVNEDDIEALTQEAARVRTTAKADALAQLGLLFNQRLAQGKVLEPATDSAKFYLAQLEQSAPTHPSTQTAHQAFAARTLDEAKAAARREDYAGAQRWLTEAHDAGVDAASIAGVNNDIKAAQDAAKRALELATPADLEITHYVPPAFPASARKLALSGWVDVEFMVLPDGSVSDLTVVGAVPAGQFEQSALDAVRKWKYRPILRDGQPITRRARVRVRFALEQVTAKRTNTSPRLLVVEDDARYGQWLGHHLGVFCPDSRPERTQPRGIRPLVRNRLGVATATSFCSRPRSGRARGPESARPGVAPPAAGRATFPAVISLAEDGNELTAVRALQLGAVDYLPKRLLTPERLNTSVRLALRRIEKRVQRKLASLAHVTDAAPPEDETTREQPKPGIAAVSRSQPGRLPTPAATPAPGSDAGTSAC